MGNTILTPFPKDSAVVGVEADRVELQAINSALWEDGFQPEFLVVTDTEQAVNALSEVQVVLFVLSAASLAQREFVGALNAFMSTESLEHGRLGVPVMLDAIDTLPLLIESRKPISLVARSAKGIDAGALGSQLTHLITETCAGRGHVHRPKRVVFAAMPFGDCLLNIVYARCVEAGIHDAGIQCAKGSDPKGGSDVVRQVVDLIQDAPLVLADLSGNNPNVLWEVGLAQALGCKLILLRHRNWPMDRRLRHKRARPTQPTDGALSKQHLKLRRRAGDMRLPFMVRGLRVENYDLRGSKEARRDELARLRTEIASQVRELLLL